MSAFACLIALIMAFVPLFNVLGYESATVFCVFATLFSGAIAVRRLSDGTLSLGREPLGGLFLALCGRAAAPLAAPFAVLSLNALRVPNCDFLLGVALYLLLPVASVVVVCALALLTCAVTGRRRLRWLGYYALIAISVGASIGHLISEPPIVVYHLTIGYFAGSIYDEALALPPGLLAFRLYCGALVAMILSALAVVIARQRRQSYGPTLAVFALSAALLGTIYAQRFELRIEANRGDIVEALGGVVESEHFVIYYPLSYDPVARNIEQVVADHEYRWHQLEAFFGVTPETPVYSFIYASRSQKQRLMGAGRTLIAKPWLGEMHITYSAIGQGHLAHELAHVFSERFGSGPLALAGGLRVDMGLIEGAATAGAWDATELTYHGWAAALFELELAPDLSDILGAAGFWTRYSRTAYTLMGSFCRWLVDNFGSDRFREVYGSGDFEGAYDRDVGSLVADWRAFLSTFELTADDLEIARFRYDRPSIFGKRCARSIAERGQRAGALVRGTRYDEAIECLDGIVADDPDNLGYSLFLARTLRQAGEYDAAEARARSIADSESAGATHRARAQELLGDIAWSRGDAAEAHGYYNQVAETALASDDARRVAVKQMATVDEAVREAVYRLFLQAPPEPRDSVTLMLAEQEYAASSPLLAYLLGLRLYEARDYSRALRYFERAESLPSIAPTPRSAAAISRRLALRTGQALFFLGRHDEARQLFASLAASGDVNAQGWAREALDWAERCEWTQRRGG